MPILFDNRIADVKIRQELTFVNPFLNSNTHAVKYDYDAVRFFTNFGETISLYEKTMRFSHSITTGQFRQGPVTAKR